mmetsp:Transcript_29793/g.38993  ORF Transcript_29793/g.38993 Transcript_29793/m.38993 type:complete len:95 (-) Transcript_29793:1372-1656(-)
MEHLNQFDDLLNVKAVGNYSLDDSFFDLSSSTKKRMRMTEIGGSLNQLSNACTNQQILQWCDEQKEDDLFASSFCVKGEFRKLEKRVLLKRRRR